MLDMAITVAIITAQSLALLVVLLVFVAYLIYADRKIWAAVQMRRGPNVVGPWGLLQSFADMLKFVFKEVVIPSGANKGVYLLAPIVTCTLGLAGWAVVPVAENWVVAGESKSDTTKILSSGTSCRERLVFSAARNTLSN